MSNWEAVSLLVVAAGAFFMPILGGILSVPAAVLEILFGTLVGSAGFGLVENHAFLDFMARFGFAYLMFLAGKELDFTFLEEQGIGGLFRGSLAVAGILLCALLLVAASGLPLFYILVFGSLSIGILVALLQEWRQTKTPVGQDLLLIGSLGEFAAITLLTLFHIVSRAGLGWPFLYAGLRLVAVLLAGLLFLKTLQLAVWWYPERFHRLLRTWDPSELGVRAGFLVMMGFVAISALLHVEYILGAFVGGAAFSYVFRERGVLEVKLAGAGYGFFIPIFFIHVGIAFDPRLFFRSEGIAFASLLLLGTLATKLPVGFLLALQKRGLREVIASPFLLASPLTLLVAIGAVGRDLGSISRGEESGILLVAILSALLFPIAGRIILRAGAGTGEVGSHAGGALDEEGTGAAGL